MKQPDIDEINGRLPSIPSESLQQLRHVATTMESLEIRLSILSVQMQYANSSFADHAVDLSRQLGETNEQLQRLLMSTEQNDHSLF